MALARLFCAYPSMLKGKVVLELGSGTGLLGCICSRLGCEKIVMTDLKQVLPRLQLALKINCRGQNAAVRKLEWGKPTDEEQIMEELEQVLPDVNPRKIHPRIDTNRFVDTKTRVFIAQDSHNTEAIRILEEKSREIFEVSDLKDKYPGELSDFEEMIIHECSLLKVSSCTN
eukprot:755957-Hanusia_phi.AAC.3